MGVLLASSNRTLCGTPSLSHDSPKNIQLFPPTSWEDDALFQPEPRARYRAMLGLGYTDAFRSLHVGEVGQFTFWDYFRQAFEHDRGIRIELLVIANAGRSTRKTRDR
jgi:exonuclease III